MEDCEVTDRPLALAKRCSEFAEQRRTFPGLVGAGAGTVIGNWYRFTTRDFETFARMAPGDRYPQALRSAWQRFQEALRERAALGEVLVPGTSAYYALKDRLVTPYRNDAFDEKWRKLLPDQPSWTVTAHLSQETYSHIHYDSRQARAVTIREAARLQSFPDGFLFSGNHGEQFRQIGNAVPPLLAQANAGEVVGERYGRFAFCLVQNWRFGDRHNTTGMDPPGDHPLKGALPEAMSLSPAGPKRSGEGYLAP